MLKPSHLTIVTLTLILLGLVAGEFTLTTDVATSPETHYVCTRQTVGGEAGRFGGTIVSLSRKTTHLKRRLRTLLNRFEENSLAVAVNVEELGAIPPCLGNIIVNALPLNGLGYVQIAQNLQSDFDVLIKILGHLRQMRHEDGLYRGGILADTYQSVEASVNDLLCVLSKALVGLGRVRITTFQTRIETWCVTSSACSRNRRDVILLTEMRRVASNLHNKYNGLSQTFGA